MNEDRLKVRLGKECSRYSGYVKPKGKFWKRLMNKRVRKGATYKRTNWWNWS